MSHMTADLEYFKCDMCGVYMHRDIFCDHRRDCHGLGSTQLKRGECQQLAEALGRDTRELLLSKQSGSNARATSGDTTALSSSPASPAGAAGAAPCAGAGGEGEAAAAGCAPITAMVSTEAREKRLEAQTRRAVSDRYQATLDAKISALLTEDKKAALMDFLNS